MKTKSEEIDRIALWIILTGGLMALLFYGLASFLAAPTVETITTHAPATNADNSAQEIKFQSNKSR